MITTFCQHLLSFAECSTNVFYDYRAGRLIRHELIELIRFTTFDNFFYNACILKSNKCTRDERLLFVSVIILMHFSLDIQHEPALFLFGNV